MRSCRREYSSDGRATERSRLETRRSQKLENLCKEKTSFHTSRGHRPPHLRREASILRAESMKRHVEKPLCMGCKQPAEGRSVYSPQPDQPEACCVLACENPMRRRVLNAEVEAADKATGLKAHWYRRLLTGPIQAGDTRARR